MEELMSILEGVCPNCGSELKLIRVAGVRQWLQEQGRNCTPEGEGKVEVHTWARACDSDVGCLTFRCGGCGQQFEAYANRFGDWAM
jgi:hypothetical protein